MPLIFAVDSDQRQSAQLASVLRSHVDADLVPSATVLDGIDVLRGRIPDAVLTSSLLSPRDESALANHVRELGARAAHVHTLTIPVLAGERKVEETLHGVLGLRREKGGDVEPVAVAEPEALDSDAVAPMTLAAVTDQGPGALYLDQPESIARDALMAQPPATVADAFAPPEAHVPVVDMRTFDDLDALAAQFAAPSGATPAVSAPAPAVDPFEQFFVPRSTDFVEAGPDARAPTTIELLSLGETPDNGVKAADEFEVESAPMAVPAVSSDTWFERMTAIVHSEAPAKPDVPQVPEPVFSWIDNQHVSSLSDVLSRVRASNADAHELVPPRRAAPAVETAPASIVEQAPARVVTRAPAQIAAVEAEAPIPITVVPRPEVVVDFVLPPAAPFLDPDVLAIFGAAVHRAGLDALESLSRPKPVERDRAIPIPPTPGSERPPRVARESKAERRPLREPSRPAQDEWGMYDPNQCGPAALFDEDAWNEVDADEKTPARRPRAT